MNHWEKMGETYFEHMNFALYISLVLFISSLAALIHAILPWFFKNTASEGIKYLAEILDKRKNI